MAKLTKQQVAINLLFWLLPWPLSRILPKSMQIAYFGPSLPPLTPGDSMPWIPGYDPTNPWDPMFPNPPPHPGPETPSEWTEYFDEDYWEKGILIDWDTDRWKYTGTAQTLKLYVKSGSTWAHSWRPTTIRLSYTCTDTTVHTDWLIRDAPGNQMGSGHPVDDGSPQVQDITLDFSGCGDLYQIIFIMELTPASYTLEITNIELYGPIY